MAYSLADLQTGKRPRPPRLAVYGPDKIGKSTFASQAPKPVFIQTEDGLDALDVAKYPKALTLTDVHEQLQSLIEEDHDYQTLVIDSMDWLESLIWKHVCKQGDDKGEKSSIEDFGYGKGYVRAADELKGILRGLDILRDKKNMAVILVAHSLVKRFDDPMSEPYERYVLKLHKSAAALVAEWVDALGFASLKIVVHSKDVGFDKEVTRGMEIGGHILNLKRSPAFDAGNRYSMPAEIALNWSAFADAFADAHK